MYIDGNEILIFNALRNLKVFAEGNPEQSKFISHLKTTAVF
jgi:hypothetical protein